ncbi:MAG: hydroxymethylglutaryl-CoA lyase [Rhodospirillales bacterium]
MSDMPKTIRIKEEGPREGFQSEPPIPTARKIELVDALSETGIRQIQVGSFVNPKQVPTMADIDALVAGIKINPKVSYTGLWFNERGFLRALDTGRLDVKGTLQTTASETFLQRNQKRTLREQLDSLPGLIEMYKSKNVPVPRGSVMAAFGCSYEGDIPPSRVVGLVSEIFKLSDEHDLGVSEIALADTMAWATPDKIKRVVGAVREKFPQAEINLHLHDTRGMGIVNVYAGLEMGVDSFDSSIGGLGGCPFTPHRGASGNVCTEDLVFMCEEMGIETGIDLDKLIEAAELAEEIVGHPLPGQVKFGKPLDNIRRKLKQQAAE